MATDKKADLAAMRLRYSRGELHLANLDDDPLAQFAVWFEDARAAKVCEPNAMVLATVSADGQPSARTVLLKGCEDGRFAFFTNYTSRKAADLEASDGKAALHFAWLELERQVKVRGRVEKSSREDSERYFRSRPRESQIGAWASDQSSEVESRAALEQSFTDTEARFEGGDVPLPEFWGGYALVPEIIEFWQGRPGRLHDRFEYRRSGDGWELRRLSP